MDGDEEHGGDEDGLHVHELDRVDGRHGERRRLLVRVVELVEVLVQEGGVVDAVAPVGQIVLGRERCDRSRSVDISFNQLIQMRMRRFGRDHTFASRSTEIFFI